MAEERLGPQGMKTADKVTQRPLSNLRFRSHFREHFKCTPAALSKIRFRPGNPLNGYSILKIYLNTNERKENEGRQLWEKQIF